MIENNLFNQMQKTIDNVLKTRKAVRENLLCGMAGERLEAAKTILQGYGAEKVRSSYDGKTVTEREEIERDFYGYFDTHRMGNRVGAFYGEQIINAKELKECAKIIGSLKMYNLISSIIGEQETSWELNEFFIMNIFSFEEIASLPPSTRKTLWEECEQELKICMNSAPKETVETFLDIFTDEAKEIIKEDIEYLDNHSAKEVKSAKQRVFYVARHLLPDAPQDKTTDNIYRTYRISRKND